MTFKKAIKTSILLIILGGLFLVYSYIEAGWIKTTRLTVSSPDIPESFDGKTIVFISDIHLGPYLSVQKLRTIIERINNLNADFILMGGDYVFRGANYIEPFFYEAGKLKAKHGIFAVLGNHDHYESAERTRLMMMKERFNLCDNKSYWVKLGKDSIKIGGVGDMWEDVQILDSTTHDVKKSDFCILLSHHPDYIENMAKDKVDLTLSGHTHGGQVTLFGLYAPLVPSKYGQKYRYGLKKFGKMQSYITSGVGNIAPPLRFFCRPEIVLITLKKQ